MYQKWMCSYLVGVNALSTGVFRAKGNAKVEGGRVGLPHLTFQNPT